MRKLVFLILVFLFAVFNTNVKAEEISNYQMYEDLSKEEQEIADKIWHEIMVSENKKMN